MSKIRINVLARELEVKSHLILELLPEFGVTEKLTHSSSIDDDVAYRLKKHFGVSTNGESPSAVEEPEAVSEERQPVAAVPPVEAPRKREPEPALVVEAAPPQVVEETAAAVVQPPPAAEPAKPAMRLRPPLASGSQPPSPRPSGPSTPMPGHSAPPMRPPGIPARPLPSAAAPAPGQAPTGPRAPFPASAPAVPGQALPRPAITARPAGPSGPGAPMAPAPPQAPASRPGAPGPAQPAALRPPTRPGGLVGQPAARPIVPPRPDLALRLAQQQQPRAASPGQPTVRPGVPLRPQAPSPGKPIYQGPIRPGQPMVARQQPGRPGAPTGPPRPGGPRPMHPTSRPMGGGGAEPVPAGGDNRHAKNKSRQQRIREEQEGKLGPMRRREERAVPPPITREITISEGVTVKELAEKLEAKVADVIKKLVEKGIFATINQTLDQKLAEELAREFGASVATLTYEEEERLDVEFSQEDKDQVSRPPVVTIMGHVDHGKTSLLDAVRVANVAGKEAGGITQHIGAYHVERNGKNIVFIDTPGHEAFTRMRARGAKVTDIVILVVAADDGVMPQTREAIDHARAAKVPIIVAINKIDKPDAQPDRIKQQLSDLGLLAEDWGGDVVMVPVSAKQKINLDLLLEMILLVAELQNLRANPARPAMGAVLEAKLDKGRGPVATVLVRNGTLRVGDFFICGLVFGKVRAMLNDYGQQVREVGPSMPVEVLGLESMPDAGDQFQVVSDTAKAKQIVLFREARAREVAMAKNKRITLEQFNKQMAEGEVKELNLIIKADVSGSAEVLSDTLQKLSNEKVRVKVLLTGVGAITETDVVLASASNAIIIGFNVRPARNAAAVAEQEKIDIRLHTIIYNVTDEIKLAMSGLLAPTFKETFKGRAEVKETFRVSKVGTIAGCVVVEGSILRSCGVRLLRDNVVVFTGKIGSLRRFKDDVSEVKGGQDCGIMIDNFSDVKVGDVIEAFVTEAVVQSMFS